MDLRASFSPEERLKFVQDRFRAGLVVKLFCDFTAPPKFKRLVLVATGTVRPLVFVINSKPTEFALQSERLRDQQIPIKKEGNAFLDHDSYIDCSTAYSNFDKQEIKEALTNDTTLMLGRISPETAAAIMDSISDSSTLSPNEIRQISNEISQLF